MTTPTNNDVPSNSIQDRLFNSEKLDEVVNSDNTEYTDRKGVKRYTLSGLKQLITNWLSTMGTSSGANNVGWKDTTVGGQLDFILSGQCLSNISDLRLLSPRNRTDKILIKNTEGYRNGGIFIFDSSDTTTSDDGVFTIVCSDGCRFKRFIENTGVYQIDWWLNPSTDLDDYSLVINKAANYVKTTNANDTSLLSSYVTGVTLVGSPGVKKCLTPAVIFAYTNNWDFNNAILDFSGTTITGSDFLRVRTAFQSSVRNVNIRGKTSKDQTSNNTGLMLGSLAPNIYGVACSNINLENINIRNVSNAIRIGSNVYISKFDHCNFYGYLKGLTNDADIWNSGENISFDHCVFANGVMPLALTKLSFKFNHCSFDYNGFNNEADMLTWKDNGLFTLTDDLTFSQCHFEWGNTNSRWYGPVFKGTGRLIIKDSIWHMGAAAVVDSGMTYKRNTHNYFYESTDSGMTLSYLDISGLRVVNADFNGGLGAWGNGYKVVMDRIYMSRYINMYRNFWSSPTTDFTKYVNSCMPSLLPSSTYLNTAAAAVAAYPKSTKLKFTGDATTSYTLDSTNNVITVSTTTSVAGGTTYLDLYVTAIPRAFPLFTTQAVGDSANTTVTSDLSRVSIAGSLAGGFLDTNGEFTATQRLSWSGTGTDLTSLKPVRIPTVTGNDSSMLPPTDNNITHVRLRLAITNFYATTAGNKVTISITAPRLEFVRVGDYNWDGRSY